MVKRALLVIALVLATAGLLFAAGPRGGAGSGKGPRPNASSGACLGDCDKTQTMKQDQLQDGSCQDSVASAALVTTSSDQDRLRTQDPDHIHLRTRDPIQQQDHLHDAIGQ